MSCQRHHSFNYRFISGMFWAFPYLLWQAFGNISGFFVGVMLALILTVMFQSFVHHSYRQSTLSRQKSLQTTARPQEEEEMYRPYLAVP